jgi:hypothetical protein
MVVQAADDAADDWNNRQCKITENTYWCVK